VVFAPPENEYQWAIAVFIDQKSEASSPPDHWMERSNNHPSHAANGRSRGVVTLDIRRRRGALSALCHPSSYAVLQETARTLRDAGSAGIVYEKQMLESL